MAVSSGASAGKAETLLRKAIQSSQHRLKRWVRQPRKFVAVVSTAVAAVWIIWVISDAVLTLGVIDLQDIGTTKEMSEAGLTERAAGARLRDAIWAISISAQTSAEKTSIGSRKEKVDITIPGAGISVASIAASIRNLLPENWRHEVAGEFTAVEKHTIGLRLRLNDRVIFDRSVASLEEIDQLFHRGAVELLRKVDPYLIAAWLYHRKESDAAEELSDEIIATASPGAPALLWAYNLKGNILADRNERHDAERYYVKAIDLASARRNLGVLAEERGEYFLAEQLYRQAILRDEKFEAAHFSLGQLLFARNAVEEAIQHLKVVIKLNPQNAGAHALLGNIYYDKNEYGAALEHFSRSARLYPAEPVFHYYTALPYLEMAKLEQQAERKVHFLLKSCAALNNAAKLAAPEPEHVRVMQQVNILLFMSTGKHCEQ